MGRDEDERWWRWWWNGERKGFRDRRNSEDDGGGDEEETDDDGDGHEDDQFVVPIGCSEDDRSVLTRCVLGRTTKAGGSRSCREHGHNHTRSGPSCRCGCRTSFVPTRQHRPDDHPDDRVRILCDGFHPISVSSTRYSILEGYVYIYVDRLIESICILTIHYRAIIPNQRDRREK